MARRIVEVNITDKDELVNALEDIGFMCRFEDDEHTCSKNTSEGRLHINF